MGLRYQGNKAKTAKKRAPRKPLPPQAGIQRFRFASDDDGHHYLIPAQDLEQFNEWVLSFEEDYEYDYTGKSFDEFRINGEHQYTFLDPKLD